MHYERWRKHGDPLIVRRPSHQRQMDQSLEEFFWSLVDSSGECWLYQGSIDKQGYGRFYDGRRQVYAHHVLIGSPDEGLVWDHVCHNRDEECKGGAICLHRRCVRPEHLEQVTLAINTRRGLRLGVHRDIFAASDVKQASLSGVP